MLFSVKDADKSLVVALAQGMRPKGSSSMPPAAPPRSSGSRASRSRKSIKSGKAGPNIIDRIKSREIALLINTPEGRYTPADSYSIRRAALEYNIPYTTTLAAARATLDAIRALKRGKLEVKSLQEYHEMVEKICGSIAGR